MKMHPLIEESVLRDRSVVNQFVTLVRPSVHQKKLGKLEKALQDLDKFKGQISGTHLFRKAFNQQQVDDPTFGTGRQRAQNLMVASNVAWEALPKRQKTDFNRQARVEVQERFDELEKDREHLRHAKFIAERARKLELQNLGLINSSENCRFRHTDLIKIAEAFNDLATGQRLLPDDSERHFEAPRAPSIEQQFVFSDASKNVVYPDSTCPSWCENIIRARHHFESAAFFKDSDVNSGFVYFLLIAKKHPFCAVFLRLEQKVRPYLVNAVEGDYSGFLPERREFTYLPFAFLTADVVPFATDDDLFFFPNVDFTGERAISVHQPRHLAEELARVVQHTAPRAPSVRGVDTHIPKTTRLALMAKFPWLTETDVGLRGLALNRRRVDKLGMRVDDDLELEEGDSQSSDEESRDDEAVPEDDVDDAIREHRELVDDPNDEDSYFYSRALAGRWTVLHHGVVSDGVQSFPRGALVRKWADHYGFPPTFSCRYSIYGIANSHILCAAFCRRGDYFFRIWYADDDEDFSFTYSDAELASYQLTLPWVEFMTAMDIEDPSYIRGLQVNALLPTNP